MTDHPLALALALAVSDPESAQAAARQGLPAQRLFRAQRLLCQAQQPLGRWGRWAPTPAVPILRQAVVEALAALEPHLERIRPLLLAGVPYRCAIAEVPESGLTEVWPWRPDGSIDG